MKKKQKELLIDLLDLLMEIEGESDKNDKFRNKVKDIDVSNLIEKVNKLI